MATAGILLGRPALVIPTRVKADSFRGFQDVNPDRTLRKSDADAPGFRAITVTDR